ncbi:hypothetical protein UlMin_032242 [Ulmus minor]
MSRARFNLYVFCSHSLFKQCYELQPTFQLLLKRHDRLTLNLTEVPSYIEHYVEDTGLVHLVSGVDDMNIIYQQLYQTDGNIVLPENDSPGTKMEE